jgi:WD40 repeat protein
MPHPHRALSVLGILVWLAVAGAARAENRPGKVLRETGRWGDGRFVAGDAVRSKVFAAGRLAVGTSRGVIVWDLRTLAEVARLPLPFDEQTLDVREVMLSPDGRRVTAGSAGGAGTWDLRTGKRLFGMSWSGFKSPGVALAPSGDFAAVWEKQPEDPSRPPRIELWDLRRGTSHPVAPDGPIGQLRFADDERALVPLERDAWFSQQPSVIRRAAAGVADLRRQGAPCRTDAPSTCTLTRPNSRWTVEVARQPRNGAVADRPLPLVSVTDTEGKDRLVIAETHPFLTFEDCHGDVCDEFPREGSDRARVALDRSGRRLAALIAQTPPGQHMDVWDLPSRRKIAAAQMSALVHDFALSESGTRILVHELMDTQKGQRHDVVVYAADTGQPLWRHENIAWGTPASSASEVWIVEAAGLVTLLEQPSAVAAGRVVAWDIDTGRERVALPIGRSAHGRPLAAGDHLALPASIDGFTILSARGGADALPSDRHAGAVARLALSDDGALLASAGHDGKLIVRPLGGRTAARVLHADAIHDLAFAPGSHQLLAAGRLHATRWDGDTGSLLGEVHATVQDGKEQNVLGARLLVGRDGVGFFRDDHSLEIRPWQGDKGIRILTRLCPRGFWPGTVSLAGPGWCGQPDEHDSFVLRELETGAVRTRAGGGAVTERWAIADDGRHLIYAENGGGIVLATTDGSDAPVRIHEPQLAGLTAAAFTPDARLAVTALWRDETVHVWDVNTYAEVDAIDFTATLDHATALAVSKKGDELFVGTARGIVYRFGITRPERP